MTVLLVKKENFYTKILALTIVIKILKFMRINN